MGKHKFLLLELLFYFLFATTALTQSSTTYRVISVTPKYDVAVVIENKTYNMKPTWPGSVLLEVEAPGNTPYQYAKIDKNTQQVLETESFIRPSREKGGDIVNEFYGREWTVKQVESIPSLSIPTVYNRAKTELHPEGEIPTIHITAPQKDIDNIHSNYLKEIDVHGNFTYISSNKVKELSGVKISLGGRSTRLFTKLAYNLKIPKGQDLFGYRKFKLRTTGNDPTYMREYFASQIRVAASLPCSHESYVRVIINQREMGLFILAEKLDDKTWLQNEFGGGNSKYKNGYLYEGTGKINDNMISDLEYISDNPEDYSKQRYEVEEEPKGANKTFDVLATFIKFIHDQKTQQGTMNIAQLDASADEWVKHFDVEGFLTNMAVDFLTGSWDSFLINSDNYFIYQLFGQDSFVYISWDFDLSFGSGPVKMQPIAVGDYNDFVRLKNRSLIVAILNVPKFKKFFEERLSLLIDKTFKPEVSYPIIDSLSDFLRQDVEWDQSLPRARPGFSFLPAPNAGDVIAMFTKGSGENKFQGFFNPPSIFSISNAIEYIFRVNANIPFDRAVNSTTGHSSLYGLKEWFKVKVDNIRRKTRYKPSLLESLLHL